MKDLAKILLYLAAAVLLGALLAPLFFKIGRSLGEAHGIRVLATSGFERYFNRAVLIAAIALLWPLAKSLRVRSVRDFGLQYNPRAMRHLAFGFFLSIGVLFALGAALVFSGVFVLRDSIPWARLGFVAISAAGASLLEELLFRGALLGLLCRRMNDSPALFCVSALYSAVHFIQPPETQIDPQHVHFLSGFALLGEVFRQSAQPGPLATGFATLFVLGWILGVATIRTRSLWLAIGLHSGCILGKFSFAKIAKQNANAMPWFGKDFLSGIGPLLVLAAMGLIVSARLRFEKNRW